MEATVTVDRSLSISIIWTLNLTSCPGRTEIMQIQTSSLVNQFVCKEVTKSISHQDIRDRPTMGNWCVEQGNDRTSNITSGEEVHGQTSKQICFLSKCARLQHKMETTQLGLRRCFHETHSLLFGLISDTMNPSYSLLLLLHQLLLLLLLLLQLATEPCAFKGLLWGKRWTHKMASNAPPNQHLCRISHHKLNNKAFLGCCKAKFKTVLVVKFSVSKKKCGPKTLQMELGCGFGRCLSTCAHKTISEKGSTRRLCPSTLS